MKLRLANQSLGERAGGMIRHGLELVCRATLSVAHLLDCAEGRLQRSVVIDVEVGRRRVLKQPFEIGYSG
jgi:hypothetical protein